MLNQFNLTINHKYPLRYKEDDIVTINNHDYFIERMQKEDSYIFCRDPRTDNNRRATHGICMNLTNSHSLRQIGKQLKVSLIDDDDDYLLNGNFFANDYMIYGYDK